MILPSFQVWGTWFYLMLMLYMCVRYILAFGPKHFKCLILMSSGPVELLFFFSFCFASCLEIVICVSVLFCL